MNTRYQKTLAVLGEEKSDREQELEEVHGDVALQWVKQRNQQTEAAFSASPLFTTLQDTILTIRSDRKNLPRLSLRGNYIYEVWRDKSHPQGLWRRMPVAAFKNPHARWENLLDLDHLPDEKNWRALLSEEQLTHNPNGSWVWSTPAFFGKQCMVGLSYGGGDSCVYREFDLETRQFVKEGLSVEDSNSLRWCDPDSLWVLDYDATRATSRGYQPHLIKRLQRGERLARAQIVYRQKDDDEITPSAATYLTSKGRAYHLLTRKIDFHHREYFLLYNDDFAPLRLDIPRDVEIETLYQDGVIFILKSDWHCPDGHIYPAGAVMAMHLAALQDENEFLVEMVFAPEAGRVVTDVRATRDYVLINVLNNINGELYRCHFNRTWRHQKLALPTGGRITIESSPYDSNDCLLTFQSFTTPLAYYYCDLKNNTLDVLKSAPATFPNENMVTHQYWATSQDGTQIPYYAVHARTLQYDGKNPALLTAYGGFGDCSLPGYLDTEGPCWLEHGGVYLVANIRGGGEFGAAWHQTALKENRHKVFEDFIAVAEDAIRRGITTAQQLGIRGSSNGGLLVGVVATQRPELFKAAICDVPLLDMVNYATTELNGKCWIAEYGDPADREMRQVLQGYSPYHVVSANKHYPEMLFTTSTADDRVHPAHARKMVDRMTTQGHTVYYHETLEGGHHGTANLKQETFSEALEFSYLHQKLMTPAPRLQATQRATRAAQQYQLFKLPEMKVTEPPSSMEEHMRKRQKLS